MLSSWGSSNYRPSAPFLFEVASQFKKNCHFGDYYYYYYYQNVYCRFDATSADRARLCDRSHRAGRPSVGDRLCLLPRAGAPATRLRQPRRRRRADVQRRRLVVLLPDGVEDVLADGRRQHDDDGRRLRPAGVCGEENCGQREEHREWDDDGGSASSRRRRGVHRGVMA